MSLLETRGLTRRFGALEAVRDVDFAMDTGEIRAVIGPNGAGKSTFVAMLCGRIPPSAGQILFDGRDITGLPAHVRIRMGMSYTFQITSIFPALPVRENVALAARALGADAGGRVDEALARVGLSGEAAARAGDLAYGHQRLLEVAMGVVQAPRLLILDEPTQGLSDAEIGLVTTLLRDLAREAAILLIEHNMRVVMELSDRITVLDAGRVLAEGTPDAIRADAAVQAAYLGSAA